MSNQNVKPDLMLKRLNVFEEDVETLRDALADEAPKVLEKLDFSLRAAHEAYKKGEYDTCNGLIDQMEAMMDDIDYSTENDEIPDVDEEVVTKIKEDVLEELGFEFDTLTDDQVEEVKKKILEKVTALKEEMIKKQAEEEEAITSLAEQVSLVRKKKSTVNIPGMGEVEIGEPKGIQDKLSSVEEKNRPVAKRRVKWHNFFTALKTNVLVLFLSLLVVVGGGAIGYGGLHLGSTVSDLVTDYRELKAEVKDLQANANTIVAPVVDELKTEIAVLKNDLENANNKIASFTKELEATNKQLDKLIGSPKPVTEEVTLRDVILTLEEEGFKQKVIISYFSQYYPDLRSIDDIEVDRENGYMSITSGDSQLKLLPDGTIYFSGCSQWDAEVIMQQLLDDAQARM